MLRTSFSGPCGGKDAYNIAFCSYRLHACLRQHSISEIEYAYAQLNPFVNRVPVFMCVMR